MGSEVCAAVRAADDMELVAALDQGDDPTRLVAAGARVAVDFTNPDVVLDNVWACLELGIHCVIGTSGFDEGRLATVRGWADEHAGLGVLVAPNFGVGAVLAMRFAALAAPFFTSCEVIEMHHPNKVDAPSGTAGHTASLIAAARAEAGAAPMPDATSSERPGARGAEMDGVRVHSVRMSGLVAHQEVLFGTEGETLTIRHDSLHRSSFMPGVLLAARYVVDHPGLTVGLEAPLGLA
jgi:4-hydroxy-tetrahydrodipicolinate reductase